MCRNHHSTPEFISHKKFSVTFALNTAKGVSGLRLYNAAVRHPAQACFATLRQELNPKVSMKISITAAPLFRLCVTRPILDVLIKLSVNHYDARCQLLYARAGHGQVNGLLRIWDDALLAAGTEDAAATRASSQMRSRPLTWPCPARAYNNWQRES